MAHNSQLDLFEGLGKNSHTGSRTWRGHACANLSACAILVARPRNIDGLEDMGAKYLPTIKDMKASQRFQQKQKPVAQPKKLAGDQPAKKAKKQ